MIQVTLYSRKDCHLCDQAIEDLKNLQGRFPHRLTIIDVDSSNDLQRQYGDQVPVVEVGPYRLKAPFNSQDLQVTLGATSDREAHIAKIDQAIEQGAIPSTWSSADRFTYWLSRHYLAILNIFVAIYLFIPFMAPIFMKVGAEAPARLIYRAYSYACHQLPYRSWFLFGEQAYYPRLAAKINGVLTFQQASGLSEGDSLSDRFAARNFVGNEVMGYKIALCERDVAIYGGILIFGIVYAATGRRWRPLPWYVWILVGILPIAVDGFSQLLSQPPFSFWMYRESTPFFRTFTGFLFGFTTAWFGYVMVEQSMAETREIMAKKFRAYQQSRKLTVEKAN